MRKKIFLISIFTLLILNTFFNFSPVYASGFTCSAKYDANAKDIYLEWTGYERKLLDTGLKIYLTRSNPKTTYQAKVFTYSGTIYASELKTVDNSKIKVGEGEKWLISFHHPHEKKWYEFNITTTELHDNKPPKNNNEDLLFNDDILENTNIKMEPIPVFPKNSSKAVMFWYYTFATLTGVFVFLTILRTGYQYIVQTDTNPGARAETITTIQKCLAGFIIIMVAPLFVQLLVAINDAFVAICLKGLNMMTSGGSDVTLTDFIEQVGFIDKIFAAPFLAINNMICLLFGISPIGVLVFNEAPQATPLGATGFLTTFLNADGLNTGNFFTDALLALTLILFTLYFNVVYLLRHWVIIAVLAATPIIIWIWVLSNEKNVIYLWFAELVQTIFIQSAHAVTFAVVFSIMCFNPSSGYSTLVTNEFSFLLFSIGKFVAYFAGIIAVGFVTLHAFRMVTTSDERVRADAKNKTIRIFIGLTIISLALMIASAITPSELPIHHINLGEGEKGKITVFQLIVGLATIIPISKMFSMIFMNFLARIGTVDEFAVAGKVTGGLAGLTVLAGGINKGIQSIRDLSIKKGEGSSENSVGSPLVGGQVREGTTSYNYANISQNSGEYNFNNPTRNTSSGTSTYSTENNNPLFTARTAEDIESKRQSQKEIQDKTMSLETIKKAQTVGNPVRETGGAIGRGIGMTVGLILPPMANLATNIGYGVGRAFTPLATGASIINQYRKSGTQNLAEYTGKQTALGGITQMGTAVFASAFSSSSANAYQTSLKVGSMVDNLFSKNKQT